MTKLLSALMITGLLFTGCAHKNVVQPTDQSMEQKATGSKEGSKDKQGDKQTDKKIPTEAVSSKDADNAASADSMRLLKEMQAKLTDIHFDFDKYDIRSADKPILRQVADTLAKNGKLKVIIEGNCDERGTNEYNLALGDKRAAAAKGYLSSLGIKSERMDVISYGEERPVCKESSEDCWAKNRRDHFVLDEAKR